MTFSCYEFLGCKEQNCLMRKEAQERACWEVDPSLTPCLKRVVAEIRPEDKIIYCQNCLFYQYANKQTISDQNLDSLITQTSYQDK